MSSGIHSVSQSFVSIGFDAGLCLGLLIYVRGWFRLRTVSRNLIPAWRLGAFLAGVGCVWLAIGSSLAALDDVSLSIHMIQHLLLMAIAAPLILLGAPELPLLRGLPQAVARNFFGPILRWRVTKSLAALFDNLAVAWFAAALTLIVWHIPFIFELALRSTALHVFEHATFFVTGLIFWRPVVEPWPTNARSDRWVIPLYLFFATLPCDALSGFLAFCDRVVYSSYLAVPPAFNISPLQDQQRAAALMWVSVTIIYLVPAITITIQILSPQANQQTCESAPTDPLGLPPQHFKIRKIEML